MAEYIELESLSADGCVDSNKIRTPFAKIIVGGSAEKPCYSILWFDATKNEYIIGYSSFCLEYVFKWLEEEFEIVDGDEAPEADVAPVRHGRWEKIGMDKRGRGGIFKCTACGRNMPHISDFCPNCGAKMDEEDV